MKKYTIVENDNEWFLPPMELRSAFIDFERRVNDCAYVELVEYDNNKKSIIKTAKGKYYSFIEKAIDNMYDVCGGSMVIELSDFTISLVDTGNKIIQLNIYKKGYESSYDFDWNDIKNVKEMISDMARRLKNSIENYYEIQMHKQIEKTNGEIEQWNKNK